jgi:hypothetical protein
VLGDYDHLFKTGEVRRPEAVPLARNAAEALLRAEADLRAME